MVATCVKVKSSAVWFCLSHCLSEGSKQGVGLLFGEKNCANEINVYDAVFTDKEKDGGDDLAIPSLAAINNIGNYSEALSTKHEKQIYCVGMYQSHVEFSCEPTKQDFELAKTLSETLSPEFMMMIFFLHFTPETERLAKYPLCEEEFIEKFVRTYGESTIECSRKIEILSTQVDSSRKLCLVPTIFVTEPRHTQPKSFDTFFKMPANAFKLKRKMFKKEWKKCGDLDNEIAFLTQVQMKNCQNAELLQITSMYAPILSMLDKRHRDSLRKQSQLVTYKRDLLDDLRHMRKVVSMEQEK